MEKYEYDAMYKYENNHWWYLVLDDLIKKYLDNKINDDKINTLHIFDAGCGTGRMIKLLSSYGEVHGIDFSEEAVNFSRKRGCKNVKKEDLNKWNPKNQKYDVITCLDVLYHSNIKDDLDVMKVFYRALKSDGILIMNVPAFDFLKRNHDLKVSTKKRYIKKILKNNLKKIGFKIEIQTYRLPLLFFVISFKKIIEFFLKSTDETSELKELPTFFNRLLFFVHRLENRIILSRVSIPFGSSVFVVCRK